MQGRTLLIIYGERIWREVTAKYFTVEQYKTYTAATCAEGIQLAEKLRPDYILLDYHLGEAGVCAHIRSSKALKKTLILIISGDETRREAAYSECQADHFILKCTPCKLIHEIIRGLDRRVCWDCGIIENGDLRLEELNSRVFHHSKLLVHLSRDRFTLLSLLLEKSPDFVTELAIAEHIYDPEIAPEKKESIKILLHRLRHDLGPLADRIQNQRSFGWAYIPPCPDKTFPSHQHSVIPCISQIDLPMKRRKVTPL